MIVKDEMSETMSSVTKTISVKQSNCYQPTGFTINNIGASTLKIGWEANETVYGFKIRKRVVGEKIGRVQEPFCHTTTAHSPISLTIHLMKFKYKLCVTRCIMTQVTGRRFIHSKQNRSATILIL